jgi:hypothetical protein
MEVRDAVKIHRTRRFQCAALIAAVMLILMVMVVGVCVTALVILSPEIG